MRVATFNIHHGTVGRRGPVDPERLGATCAEFDADVLMLEEVDVGTLRSKGADLAAVAAEACGMEHAFGAARRFPGGWYGNALLVRGEIRSWSVVHLPKVPRWHWQQERRTALTGAVRVGGQDLRVVGTHLAVPQEVNGPQLHALLKLATSRPEPVVVLGDLNREPDAVVPHATACGLGWVDHPGTIPVRRPHRAIDHVLHSEHFRVVGHDVRSTPMSDHAALLVDLELVETPLEAPPR